MLGVGGDVYVGTRLPLTRIVMLVLLVLLVLVLLASHEEALCTAVSMQSLHSAVIHSSSSPSFSSQVSGNIMLVSGNILSSAENEERIRCHFQGKQYLGWKAVRDKLKHLKEMFDNKPARY